MTGQTIAATVMSRRNPPGVGMTADGPSSAFRRQLAEQGPRPAAHA